ncbi:hypothetical protein ACHAWF_009319 [Thalassiosira exigua]
MRFPRATLVFISVLSSSAADPTAADLSSPDAGRNVRRINVKDAGRHHRGLNDLFAKSHKAEKELDKRVYVPVKTYQPGFFNNICRDEGISNIGKMGFTGDIPCEKAIEEGIGQTGVDVTCNALGTLDTTIEPLTTPFVDSGLCPTNVHAHIGAEHNSDGQFDSNAQSLGPTYANPPDKRKGKRCNFYDPQDPRFTTEFDWKHCNGFRVGETYEFHWPSSTRAVAGATCGEVTQYQTPLFDGLFCNTTQGVIDAIKSGGAGQAVAENVGVQAQVFTVINDDNYVVPNLIMGMVVDHDRMVPGNGPDTPKQMGVNLTIYTGGTTGDQFDNTPDGARCDDVGPVTWQVDRDCHLLSASSLDRLCYDIKTMAGMRHCGYDPKVDQGDSSHLCTGFPDYGLFPDPEHEGKFCCFPDTRPDGSRGVNPASMASDNQKFENCE